MIKLKDIVVTSIKKIVLDSYDKHLSSIPITFKFDKKDSEVNSVDFTVAKDSVEGSIQLRIVGNLLNNNLITIDLKNFKFQDLYGKNYTITSHNIESGIINLNKGIFTDLSAGDSFKTTGYAGNVVKIFESASIIDKTRQTTRGLRVRVKPFDITISCKDDSGEVADKIGTWLTYILSNEHYRAYDELGNVVGNRIFYTYRQPQFSSVGREVNNSLYYGRVSFAIYEDYCDKINNL